MSGQELRPYVCSWSLRPQQQAGTRESLPNSTRVVSGQPAIAMVVGKARHSKQLKRELDMPVTQEPDGWGCIWCCMQAIIACKQGNQTSWREHCKCRC